MTGINSEQKQGNEDAVVLGTARDIVHAIIDNRDIALFYCLSNDQLLTLKAEVLQMGFLAENSYQYFDFNLFEKTLRANAQKIYDLYQDMATQGNTLKSKTVTPDFPPTAIVKIPGKDFPTYTLPQPSLTTTNVTPTEGFIKNSQTESVELGNSHTWQKEVRAVGNILNSRDLYLIVAAIFKDRQNHEQNMKDLQAILDQLTIEVGGVGIKLADELNFLNWVTQIPLTDDDETRQKLAFQLSSLNLSSRLDATFKLSNERDYVLLAVKTRLRLLLLDQLRQLIRTANTQQNNKYNNFVTQLQEQLKQVSKSLSVQISRQEEIQSTIDKELVIDEVKSRALAITEHLKLTNTRINKYLLEISEIIEPDIFPASLQVLRSKVEAKSGEIVQKKATLWERLRNSRLLRKFFIVVVTPAVLYWNGQPIYNNTPKLQEILNSPPIDTYLDRFEDIFKADQTGIDRIYSQVEQIMTGARNQ